MHEFIESDLAPWKDSGITLEALEEAENMYDICDGDIIRFQIISGRLYVYHVTSRGLGWYPSQLGEGHLAARGRVPHTMLMLLDVLRLFPGQIPDLDAVMQLGDFNCVERNASRRGAPVPMFGYSTSEDYHDLVLPDFTYYGHEYDYLMDPWGNPVIGWDAQREVLMRKYEGVPLSSRLPQALWRGRTRDPMYPHRDALRRAFVACPEVLAAGGRAREAALINAKGAPIVMQDFDDFRYQVHVEPLAWVSNLRQKLAGGAVTLATGIKYKEWYARALEPGRHYVEVGATSPDMCRETVEVVQDMNALLAQRGDARADAELTPTLRSALRAWRDDRQLSALLEAADGTEARSRAVVKNAHGDYRWGSELGPVEMGDLAREFVRSKLRMQDVLLYARDMLQAYAAKQKFVPAPRRKAFCVDGAAVLQEFGTPYQADADTIARAYPWLLKYDGGCAPRD